MPKIIVQHFVENLLKVLKVLKTRTALKKNGLAELRMRYARQGAKAPFKTKEQSKRKKLEKNLTNVKFYDIINYRKGVNIMPYKYNEKGKVIGYTPSIGGFMKEPYTTNKKTGEWESRSGQLTRQRINQLDKEKKIAWF